MHYNHMLTSWYEVWIFKVKHPDCLKTMNTASPNALLVVAQREGFVYKVVLLILLLRGNITIKYWHRCVFSWLVK